MGFLDKTLNRPSKEEIPHFNFFLSFDYLPKVIEDHNFRRTPFDKALKFDTLRKEHPEFDKLLSKVKILDTGVKNWPNVKLYLINLPTNETMPEVACAIIGHESTLNIVRLYTVGYSIGGFAVYTPAVKSHTTNYNGLAQYAANQQARANMAELSYSQNQIRQQIGDGYVKMHTIPAETEYSGFFNVKYNKKMQGLTYTIVIDGEPYTFYF